MRDGRGLAILILGFLVGWAASYVWPSMQTIPLGNVLTSITTLIVALWIQQIIRVRSELDKIPIEWIGRFFDRVDALLAQILDSATAEASAEDKQKLVALIRSLANEITDFGPIVRTLAAAEAEYNEIANAQHVLKVKLTDDVVQLEAGFRVARKMRTINLALRWKLCRKILESPDRFDRVIAATVMPTSEDQK